MTLEDRIDREVSKDEPDRRQTAEERDYQLRQLTAIYFRKKIENVTQQDIDAFERVMNEPGDTAF